MREDFLQYIWQFRYFNHQRLATESGHALEILSPGRWNRDQGPDFRDARIRIGDRIAEGPSNSTSILPTGAVMHTAEIRTTGIPSFMSFGKTTGRYGMSPGPEASRY